MTGDVLFVSYSHKDRRLKEKLLSQLGVLQQDDSIRLELWSDDRIGGGSDWERELNNAMNRASVAILLITDNFLTSDFIKRIEVPRLLERRAREGLTVFPLIARSCAWRRVKWLTKMEIRPKSTRPIWKDGGRHVDDDLADVVEEVATILEKTTYGSGRKEEIAPEPVLGSELVPGLQRILDRHPVLHQPLQSILNAAQFYGLLLFGKEAALSVMVEKVMEEVRKRQHRGIKLALVHIDVGGQGSDVFVGRWRFWNLMQRVARQLDSELTKVGERPTRFSEQINSRKSAWRAECTRYVYEYWMDKLGKDREKQVEAIVSGKNASSEQQQETLVEWEDHLAHVVSREFFKKLEWHLPDYRLIFVMTSFDRIEEEAALFELVSQYLLKPLSEFENVGLILVRHADAEIRFRHTFSHYAQERIAQLELSS